MFLCVQYFVYVFYIVTAAKWRVFVAANGDRVLNLAVPQSSTITNNFFFLIHTVFV